MEENKRKKLLNIFKLNRAIWLLTVSDIFTWGLYLPLTALTGLYLAQLLNEDTVSMVAVGFGIYYFVRSATQIPIGILVDKIGRDRDDILILMAGNILMGMAFFFYPSIQSAGTFFVLQFFLGLGASMNLVTWRKLFAKNLDLNKEGTSYAVYDTILSASVSVFSLIIGFIANIGPAYFNFIVILVGILIMSSAIWPIMILFVNNRNSKEIVEDNIENIDSENSEDRIEIPDKK